MMPPESSDDDRKSALRNQIDENLRRIYNAALVEEVPDRFKILLRQLRESDAAQGAPLQGAGGQTHAGPDVPGTVRPQDSAESGT